MEKHFCKAGLFSTLSSLNSDEHISHSLHIKYKNLIYISTPQLPTDPQKNAYSSW